MGVTIGGGEPILAGNAAEPFPIPAWAFQVRAWWSNAPHATWRLLGTGALSAGIGMAVGALIGHSLPPLTPIVLHAAITGVVLISLAWSLRGYVRYVNRLSKEEAVALRITEGAWLAMDCAQAWAHVGVALALLATCGQWEDRHSPDLVIMIGLIGAGVTFTISTAITRSAAVAYLHGESDDARLTMACLRDDANAPTIWASLARTSPDWAMRILRTLAPAQRARMPIEAIQAMCSHQDPAVRHAALEALALLDAGETALTALTARS